jgi:hypothetical protein
MKQLNILFFFLGSGSMVHAQETQHNQNPNWKKSLEKYEANKDKLTQTQGTTEQKTYKAYDWTEAKNERKQQRRDYRQQRALARINRPTIWGGNQMNFYDPLWYPGRNRFWIY